MSPEERYSILEKRLGGLTALFSVITVALCGVAGYQTYRIHELASAKSLRLRELRIYDDKGVDRVVISGRLPQALLNGKASNFRPRSMAGMLIYDESGTERGGYGTMDGYANALLTLDGKENQVFLLLAEPEGSPFFMQHDGKGFVFMGVGTDGKPFLTLREGKDVVFAKPENNTWATGQLR
jgi:hypothetical protein